MQQKLECLVAGIHGDVEVLSPSIGVVQILVKQGQLVQAGQAVARLWRLGLSFELILPEGFGGLATWPKGLTKNLSLGYAEKFIRLEHAETVNSKTPGEQKLALGGHDTVCSPMDGMFYLSASPKDAPFVAIGQAIKPGQTLGLIEVMKCFYPLLYTGRAEAIVAAVNVKNATPVTSGMELFFLKNS